MDFKPYSTARSGAETVANCTTTRPFDVGTLFFFPPVKVLKRDPRVSFLAREFKYEELKKRRKIGKKREEKKNFELSFICSLNTRHAFHVKKHHTHTHALQNIHLIYLYTHTKQRHKERER